MSSRMRIVMATLLAILVGGAFVFAAYEGDGGSARAFARDVRNDRKREFTDRFLAEVVRLRPEGGCTLARPLTIDCAGAEISLDRVWNFCVDNASECDPIVLEFASGMMDVLDQRNDEPEATREQLRVSVRDPEYVARFVASVDGAVVRPIGGDLAAIVMVDLPTTARSFGRADREALGLDEDAAFALGLGNTIAELPVVADDVKPACSSPRGITHGYFYETTRVLDAAWVTSMQRSAGRPLLVALPSNDTVLLAVDCDDDASSLAAEATRVARASPRPLSTSVFRLTSEGPTPLAPLAP